MKGLSYTTVRKAYLKMLDLRQYKRAYALNKLFKQINDDRFGSYDIRLNSLTLNGDGHFYGEFINQEDTPHSASSYSYRPYKYTSSSIGAKKMEEHIMNFHPNTILTKNDFRY